MKNKIFIIIFLLISASAFADGYKIKLKVKGVSDTIVYFAKYYADKKYVSDTLEVNHKGEIVAEGKKKLDGGMYMFIFPSIGMSYIDVIVDDNQEFSLETDTADFIANMKVKGSRQNQALKDFDIYMSSLKNIDMNLKSRYMENKDNPDSLEVLKPLLKENGQKAKRYAADLAKKWEGTLFGGFVNATRNPEIPQFDIPEDEPKRDSILQMRRYLWNKEHFFDYVDLKDDRLIQTPILSEKIDYFIKKMVVQHPDSVFKEGVKLIEASRGSEKNFQYLVQYMFGYRDKSKLMAMDRLFVNIAERYYLSGEADWVDSTYLEKVKERVYLEKPNLIGNTAPSLDKLETYEKEFVSLSEIDAKYTVLIFWEPNCGHCKTTVPKLHKSYVKMLENGIDAKVLAFYIHKDREPWEKFIEDKNIFDWINAFDKYEFTYFRAKYDILSTPKILVLDKNKKIIGKQLGVEQVEQIIYGMEGKKPPAHEKKGKKH